MCIIGLQPVASIPLLVYDFIFNLYFTILFVLPLVKIGRSVEIDWKSSRLHEVAQRTMAASVVCLIVSFANILALVVLEGRERGVLCLTCCTVDVTINVITIHWVTTNPTGKTSKEHNNSISYPNESIDDPAKLATATQHHQATSEYKSHYTRRQTDLYNLGIDEYIGEYQQPAHTITEPMSGTVGYAGGMAARDEKSAVSPIGMHDQYRYANGRFVMITEKDDDDLESRSSSIPESQSSRKSLTKFSSPS